MFTNNYDTYKKMMMCGFSSQHIFRPFDLSMVTTSGTLIGNGGEDALSHSYAENGDFGYWLNKARCNEFPTTNKSSMENAAYGVYFGSGSTPAAKSDYTLEAPIESGLSVTNQDGFTANDLADGSMEWSSSYILQNTTSESITIREIGIVTPIGKNTSNYHCILMERSVLSSPVTIPAGEAYLLTYKITIIQ